jgi:D-alanyl-lipoteichoic acid acyltransferase DltB (MBOAT superfamily)
MIFADRFAIAANAYFNRIAAHPGWFAAWSGACAFLLQIYFDFSGYTDIARGCAKLLGFEFPLNFTRPFLAANVAEFWQRWHISLTTWIRDYVFMPLTRHRRNKAIIVRNILITMSLVGLWHGASWNFVLWGMYFGVLVAAHRIFHHAIAGTRIAAFLSVLYVYPFCIMLTFALTVVSIAFFRTSTLADAGTVLHSMFDLAGPAGENMLTTGMIVLALISFILAVLQEQAKVFDRLVFAPAWVQVLSGALVFAALELFSVTAETAPFIYFQF